jgi:hypothetical protein
MLRGEESAGMVDRPLPRFYPLLVRGAERGLNGSTDFVRSWRDSAGWAKEIARRTLVLYSVSLAFLNNLGVNLYRTQGRFRPFGRTSRTRSALV